MILHAATDVTSPEEPTPDATSADPRSADPRSADESPASDLHGLRGLLELAVCFVIVVIMLRGFFLEGYLVSTGSMAPVLLGFHKRVQCPSCDHTFAFGVRFDESVSESPLAAGGSSGPDRFASCPNCGQSNIDVSAVPRNHGDQLLVHKHAFDLRRPRRWEAVVFRNPARLADAYVKRIVGLPGETLQINDGDLFVNGSIARKDYATQRDMRILVSDLRHAPENDEWESPWQLDGDWTASGSQLACDMNSESDRSSIRLRHWRWNGGNHTVEVGLPVADAYPDWTEFENRFAHIPISWASRIEYDRINEVLRCEGVMPDDMQRDLMTSATNEAFRRAVYRLAAMSHLAPVTDHYGYNTLISGKEFFVRDVMIDTVLQFLELPIHIDVDLPVNDTTLRLRLNPQSGQVALFPQESDKPLRLGQVDAASMSAGPLHLEVSNFDCRVLVAVNGTLPFAPLDLPPDAPGAVISPMSPPTSEPGIRPDSLACEAARATFDFRRQQNRLGLTIVGGSVQINELRLFRDVYYTPGRRTNAVDTPCKIPAKCYFVQGDNSPVSSDSRSWPNPFVPHRLLLGKPFVVHLPSRPGRVTIAGRDISIRIPDFARIRYIH